MIFFKYKSLVKQIKIKSKKNLEERMAPWLQEQFNIRNPIVGFKAASIIFYSTQINTMMSIPFSQGLKNFMDSKYRLSKLTINSKFHVTKS